MAAVKEARRSYSQGTAQVHCIALKKEPLSAQTTFVFKPVNIDKAWHVACFHLVIFSNIAIPTMHTHVRSGLTTKSAVQVGRWWVSIGHSIGPRWLVTSAFT